MITNASLTYTSISQWLLFLGIALILFGWVEKKEKPALAGQLTFLLIGFMALWMILSGQIVAPELNDGNLTKQAKVFAFFKGLIWFSALNIITLGMKLFKLRYQKLGLTIVMLLALMMFFMVYSIQQMAN